LKETAAANQFTNLLKEAEAMSGHFAELGRTRFVTRTKEVVVFWLTYVMPYQYERPAPHVMN
jgi:hypothetical protein